MTSVLGTEDTDTDEPRCPASVKETLDGRGGLRLGTLNTERETCPDLNRCQLCKEAFPKKLYCGTLVPSTEPGT